MFCGPETVDVSRGEAEGNIDSRGSTKHTAFPRSQSISVKCLLTIARDNFILCLYCTFRSNKYISAC